MMANVKICLKNEKRQFRQALNIVHEGYEILIQVLIAELCPLE